ncbi:MAG: hypothetical protein PHY47_26400 [Lachnospiraceae bacterium]|nr:hypothetical protein [Lachnospiraceae bacterium]
MSKGESLEYEKILSIHKETVIVRLRGMFYNTFEESAFVLSLLTGYKVKKTSQNAMCKCGYPETAFDKVLDLLKKNHVNYVIYNGAEIIEKEIFEDNHYGSFLKEFDMNVIEVLDTRGTGKTLSKDNKDTFDNSNVTTTTFNCPNQIAEEIENLYKEHINFYGIAVYPKDVFISTLLMKGVREYKKENSDYKHD